MARLLERFELERRKHRTAEQLKACAQVRDWFGTRPISVRVLCEGRGWQDVCIVKLGGFPGPSVELIYAGGVLVGIPPKRPRKK